LGESRLEVELSDDPETTMTARTTNIHLTATLLGALALAGCGAEVTGVTSDAADKQLGAAIAQLQVENGMSQNGMSQNGMSQNGMSQNGMSQNGFATAAFQSWFNANPALSDTVMQYVAKCAAPAGTSYTWKNPTTGVTYSWSGLLGLAPGFAAGSAPTIAEQQVMTACLAAHVNKYGRSVLIAIEGKTAAGVKITVGANELTTYAKTEAGFFGNVFTGEGVFICRDHSDYVSQSAKSSLRACAFNKQTVGPSAVCPPLYYVGDCASMCQKNASGPYYDSCTFNGKTYQPLNTRIQASDIYTCGDGVCQASEHCGTGTTPDSCKADCGVCP
jgi:hypothetical protein